MIATGSPMLSLLRRGASHHEPGSARRARRKPCLEVLEDRTLLASSNPSVLADVNGPALSAELVKDILLGASPSSPAHLTDVNGTLFFTASDGRLGLELWKSDGTAAGTVMVR